MNLRAAASLVSKRLAVLFIAWSAQAVSAGNPLVPGWYADPDGVVFGATYWLYPTCSAPYGQQTRLDAFSSRDMVHWTKHERVLDTTGVSWARRAIWAPSAVRKGGKYYLFFGANDIQSDKELGGIGVAVSDRPEGPFKDHLGKPLVGSFHNGAQPIDQCVFQDEDGTHYLLYGGWGHCNIARLNADFTGLLPFPDGTTFKEITPDQYVEGVYMIRRKGKYYLMWSEGGWTGPDYSVAYAMADGPTGPFKRIGKILQQDPGIATGAGHHSVIHAGRGQDEAWYIIYHRRPLGETDGNHRVICAEAMSFDAQGLIKPVRLTHEGIASIPGLP